MLAETVGVRLEQVALLPNGARFNEFGLTLTLPFRVVTGPVAVL